MFLPIEHKFHIFSPPCNILYIEHFKNILWLKSVLALEKKNENQWMKSQSEGKSSFHEVM